MRPAQHERLLAAMHELAQTVSRLPTVPVVGACRQILECDAHAAGEEYGLHSPFRQAYYLMAMLATAPDPPPQAALSKQEFEAAWKHALLLVAEIFELYSQMYWPATREEWQKTGADVHERDAIALRAFLYQHNTGVLADQEQLLARIRAVFAPFEKELNSLIGLSGSVAAAMTEWIVKTVQHELDRYVAALQRIEDITARGLDDGLADDELFERVRTDPTLDALRHAGPGPSHPFAIRRAALAEEFGLERADAFWTMFVTIRGSVSLPLYVDEPNPVERAPLLALDDDEALLPIANPLSVAVWHRLANTLSEAGYEERFARSRAKVHEANVARVVAGFLPADALLIRAAYERADAHDEHDLVAVVGRNAIVLEAKSAPLEPVFRDPARAVKRLRDQFRSEEGIQSAFNQASRIRRRVIGAREGVPLFDRKGTLLYTLRPDEIDEVYCVCVTADDYGVLATDLSIFLERQADEPYPWAVNAYDLETFLGGLRRRAWGTDKWLQYLRERRQLHGRAHASDELEFGGAFIRNGSLESLLSANADLLMLDADMSSVFDEIFIERHGGPPARLDPPGPIVFTDVRAALDVRQRRSSPSEVDAAGVFLSPTSRAGMELEPDVGPEMQGAERNQLCYCGSGKKFKKCHGAPRQTRARPT